MEGRRLARCPPYCAAPECHASGAGTGVCGCQQLASCGTTAVFAPGVEEVYPPGFSTHVEPPEVAKLWEGELRPDHFRGVCTIVLKLFLMSGAQRAFFGQKDGTETDAAARHRMVYRLAVYGCYGFHRDRFASLQSY